MIAKQLGKSVGQDSFSRFLVGVQELRCLHFAHLFLATVSKLSLGWKTTSCCLSRTCNFADCPCLMT